MKITKKDAKHFDADGFEGFVYYEKGNTNALEVQVNGKHPIKKVPGTLLYRVESGLGKFTINNEDFQANPGDVFIINNNISYSYEGKMRLFEVKLN